jgi:transposase
MVWIAPAKAKKRGHAVKMLAILCPSSRMSPMSRSAERSIEISLRYKRVMRWLVVCDHPGIGPIGATAFAAAVTDPGQFKSGRQFAAWLGLTPLQNSSGRKERLGRISKMG